MNLFCKESDKVSWVTFPRLLRRPEASQRADAAGDDQAPKAGGQAVLTRRANGAKGPGVLGCQQPVGDVGLGDLVVHAAVHFGLPTPVDLPWFEDRVSRLTAPLLALYRDRRLAAGGNGRRNHTFGQIPSN